MSRDSPIHDAPADVYELLLIFCGAAKNARLGAADRPHLHAYGVKFWEGTMSGSRKSFSRRTFLKAAAGVTAGTGLMGQPLAAQSVARPAEAGTHSRFPRIEPTLMITPQQAWDWHVFKSQCGPTYAGSAGWKRFTDFLISKMQEFGAADLEYVEVPYDHYIVDDWPDRRTHMHDSGIAVEKLLTDGKPVPVVASYGMKIGRASCRER